jgi:hypothetical protein
MLAYWLRNFATWSGEVDELYVFVNGASPATIAHDQSLVEAAGGRFLSSPLSAGHDGAMLTLLRATSADLIVMCEDDAYVRHPGAVRAAFERIESGATDLVGSPRHEDYATSPLQEWGPYTPGDLAELRHGLWPAFLFARRADLLATDRIFGDRGWPRGGEIAGWGPVTPETCAYIGIAAEFVHLDTFFGTTLQLRAAGLRTELVHRVRVYDERATEEWVAADPPWFHVTNLSTLPSVLGKLPLESLPDYGPGGGLWTRRLAWWQRVGIDVSAFLERADIDRAELARWHERFAPWVTWAEPGYDLFTLSELGDLLWGGPRRRQK